MFEDLAEWGMIEASGRKFRVTDRGEICARRYLNPRDLSQQFRSYFVERPWDRGHEVRMYATLALVLSNCETCRAQHARKEFRPALESFSAEIARATSADRRNLSVQALQTAAYVMSRLRWEGVPEVLARTPGALGRETVDNTLNAFADLALTMGDRTAARFAAAAQVRIRHRVELDEPLPRFWPALHLDLPQPVAARLLADGVRTFGDLAGLDSAKLKMIFPRADPDDVRRRARYRLALDPKPRPRA